MSEPVAPEPSSLLGTVMPFQLLWRPAILRQLEWALLARHDEPRATPEAEAEAEAETDAELSLGAELLTQAWPDAPDGQGWRFSYELSHAQSTAIRWSCNFELEVLIVPGDSAMTLVDWKEARAQAALLALKELSSAGRDLRTTLSHASCARFIPVNISKEEVAAFMDKMRELDFARL